MARSVWYNYANQTELAFSPGLNEDYWALAIIMLVTGTIASGLNPIVTIVKLHGPGMTFGRMPLFCWSALLMSALIIGAFPPLTVAALETCLDRHIGTSFFVANAGGDAILWQHLFWVFGHPEVYILILLPMGMIWVCFTSVDTARLLR